MATDTTKVAIHKGIEFAQKEQFKDSGETYRSGVGFGYSCGYQDGLIASQSQPVKKKKVVVTESFPEFDESIKDMSQEAKDRIDGLIAQSRPVSTPETFKEKIDKITNKTESISVSKGVWERMKKRISALEASPSTPAPGEQDETTKNALWVSWRMGSIGSGDSEELDREAFESWYKYDYPHIK
jgi:hypothetical protein